MYIYVCMYASTFLYVETYAELHTTATNLAETAGYHSSAKPTDLEGGGVLGIFLNAVFKKHLRMAYGCMQS